MAKNFSYDYDMSILLFESDSENVIQFIVDMWFCTSDENVTMTGTMSQVMQTSSIFYLFRVVLLSNHSQTKSSLLTKEKGKI